ncbi:MAG: hypothetical protein WD851_02415 [Pirellulales bacterium]
MSAGKYDAILRHACDTLSREEQLQLAHALAKQAHLVAGSEKPRTLYDALQARGVIGSITDAPSDLGAAIQV